jgi:hypothetical protein
MNNEPVAWIVRTFDADKGKTVEAIWDFKPMNTIGCTPLYTHPAKTLTDEEIYKIAMEVQTGFFPQDDTLEFARAILRKAQEK